MHLPEKISNESIWSTLSWEKRDTRSDALPMMNSFIWPLGKWEKEHICSGLYCDVHVKSTGVGFVNSVLSVKGHRWDVTRYSISFDVEDPASFICNLLLQFKQKDHFKGSLGAQELP